MLENLSTMQVWTLERAGKETVALEIKVQDGREGWRGGGGGVAGAAVVNRHKTGCPPPSPPVPPPPPPPEESARRSL